MSAKRPDVKKLDEKIQRLWNRGMSAKEIVDELGLLNTKRVYNVRARSLVMDRRKN